MTATPNKISNFVNSQVPEFVRNGSPLFVSFLEAYYEYLEQSDDTIALGKLVDRAANFNNLLDVDNSIDLFSDHLFDQYLKEFPRDFPANKATLVKNIKDFYRSKGSEKSFRFLFHALFGEDIDIYYPKNNILIASSGKWFVEKSIRVTGMTVNGTAMQSLEGLQFFVNTLISGTTSRAEAVVERVIISYESGVQIFEMFVSNQEGSFIDGELITTTDLDGNVISATIESGIISQVSIIEQGSKYNVGDLVTVNSTTGNGAVIFVSSTTTGEVEGAFTNEGGSGFRVGDQIIFNGGGGSGANAFVGSLLGTANSFFHANNYSIVSDIIDFYANVPLNSANYGFPGFANSNSNTSMSSAFTFYNYGLTGPIDQIILTANGSGYFSPPVADAVGNSAIKVLGIIGKLGVIDGGLNYVVGDTISFLNVPGSFGTGALANVVSVNVSGSILRTQIQSVPGFPPGGTGFFPPLVPLCNVNSSTGSGANVVVKSILGYGVPELDIDVTSGSIGAILSLTIGNPGSKYADSPELDLTKIGDGMATAIANVVAGTFTYPGRYLDETGFPSGFNFLQDADYYQNFSYVIRVKQSIDQYRKYVKNLVHPAGMKMWGQYELVNDPNANVNIATSNTYNSERAFLKVPYTNFNLGYLTRSQGMINVHNASSGYVSLWMRSENFPTQANTESHIMFFGANTTLSRFSVSVACDGANNRSNLCFKIVGKDSSNTKVLDIRSNTTDVIAPNNWINMVASWDMTNVAKTTLYVSNVASLNVVTFTPNTTISYNTANIAIAGSTANTSRFLGDLTQVVFNTEFVDFNDVINRLMFISSDFYTINVVPNGSVSNGLIPVIVLTGNSQSININSGLGGNFALQGTVTGNMIPGLAEMDYFQVRIDNTDDYRITEDNNLRITEQLDP